MTAAHVLEGAMLVCFGASWPFLIARTLRTRDVKGLSSIFLWVVAIGYVCGTVWRILELSREGSFNPSLVLYILNGLMVSFEVVLYYRYRVRGAVEPPRADGAP